MYRSGKEQFLHQYTISKDEPVFLLAKANAANMSEVLCETEVGFPHSCEELQLLLKCLFCR